METIFLINQSVGRVRREVLNGREYLVAPLTMIVPGVLPGSDGPLYYPPEEIAANYRIWEGQPLVVGHPHRNGIPASAHDIDQKKNWIGNIRRVHISRTGSLRAEGWFDVEKTNRVDNRIISALKRGDLIELSTGLFVEKRPAFNGANYKGRAYTHTAHNYRPDHLAILPDQRGACSIQDGCGVLVNALYTPWQTMRTNVNEGWTHIDNHLPGKHNQKSHGSRGGGRGEDTRLADLKREHEQHIKKESSKKSFDSQTVKASDFRGIKAKDTIHIDGVQYQVESIRFQTRKTPSFSDDPTSLIDGYRTQLIATLQVSDSWAMKSKRTFKDPFSDVVLNSWTPLANTTDEDCHCGGECDECKKKLLDNYGSNGSSEQTSKAVKSSCKCGKVKCKCKPYPKGGKRNVTVTEQEVRNHLPGKHNQDSHGHGGSSESEEVNFLDMFMGKDSGFNEEVARGKAEVDTKRAAAKKEIQRIEGEIKDWSSRVYKSNRGRVTLKGDEIHGREFELGSINESKRQRKIKLLREELDYANKQMQQIIMEYGPETNAWVSVREVENATLTSQKACEILHDGTAQGHPLTEQQRRFFGAHCREKRPTKNTNNEWTPIAINT